MNCAALVIALLSVFAQDGGAPATAEQFEQIKARAQIAWEARRDAEAVDLFGKAVRQRPEWTEGWWALGVLHYDANRFQACADALAKMVRLDPTAVPGHAMLGLCEFGAKSYEPAFEHLKRAHILAPTGRRTDLLDVADYHLSLLLCRQGAFEMAHEVLLRVAQHAKETPDLVFACGLASLRMPVLPAEVPKEHREAVLLAGKTFWDLATQHPAEAEADFRNLVEKYNSLPNVHYFYGTYLAVHKPDLAAAEFMEELRVNPESVPARVQLTLRRLLEQKNDDALKYAKEAVSLSPDSVGPQLALGKALRATGDDEGALKAFVQAKALDDKSPEIRLYLVTAYRATGKLDEMRREQAEHDRLKAAQANWP